MEIGLEKILSHANERLGPSGLGEGRTHQIEAFRRFLKLETERLRMRHRFGLGGCEIATGRSYQVDLVVSRVCQLAASESGLALNAELSRCAVVALGGYGRRELAPFSDVDLLFLHEGRASGGVRSFVEQVLLLLWDMGLTVGHSFRSVDECVAIARDEVHARTALTEARHVTGNEAVFRQLLMHLDERLFANPRATEGFLASLRLEIAERHSKFGRAVCVQQPHVKQGAGGLRDLHSVLWVGHARFACRGLAQLWAEGRLSDSEYVSSRRSYDYIARVRNEAHFTTGRKTDLLTLDLQPTLAQNLGYKPKRGLLGSEIFMRDYYQRASELHRVCENFLVRNLGGEPAKRSFSIRLKPGRVKGNFVARDGQLLPRGKEFHGGPLRLVEAFSLAQVERLELSDELRLMIRSHLHLLDRRFRESREAGRGFMRILQRRGEVAAALRNMHETGFLGRFLPEFARITFLVQHDFYHQYTVDEHTLRAIEALDRAATGDDPTLLPFGKAFEEVENVGPLYLGMLLHDIGKGSGGGHVMRGVRMAERVCERLGLDGQSAKDVAFLVKAHLEMSHLSQRRDLAEPSLILAFARSVGTLSRLNMLLLLTCADHCGVGPGIWNEWKGSLLWELYTKTRRQLAAGAPGRIEPDPAGQARDKATQDLLAEFRASQIERHFAMMPEKYLRSAEAGEMVRDFRLVHRLGSGTAAVDWRSLPRSHCTEFSLVTRDRPGLFARMAGALTAHGINILSVDLYTREDGIVIDTFKVSNVGGQGPVDPGRWQKVEEDLKGAIEGRYDVAEAVARRLQKMPKRPRRRAPRASPSAVRFDSEASAASTVIEVRAEDQPGLAYCLAHTLATLRLNISFAKIATEKSHALDVFYVTGPDGQKLLPTDAAAVEASLLEALGHASRSMEETG